MTSPHAASEEVIASTATTVLDDSPPNVYLTAADNAAIDATIATKSSNDVQTTEKQADQAAQSLKDELGTMEQLRISQQTTPPPVANATTEPPRTPPAQLKNEITVDEPAIPETPDLEDGEEFPQMASTEQQQLDTLANLMSYRGEAGSAEMLNGQVMNASMADLTAQDMQHYNHDMMALEPYNDQQSHLPRQDETRISAYALLEFEDGQFYMNTYQVILGRDLAAAKAAIKRDQELEKEQKRIEAEEAGEAQTPARVKREGSKSRHARSVISESAGILREGNDSDSDDRARRRKKASKKTKSTGSTSQKVSRRPSLVQPATIEKIDYQPQPPTRRQAPDTAGAVPVDPGSLRPSPHDCPIIGIHPPATTPASGYKAISRQHVKIAYNSKKSLFEAEIIGRNGAFIDDQFYYHQDIIPLKSGSRLQIGGVVVRFVLPDVAIGETGAEMALEQEGAASERYIEGDKEMSFDFERPSNAAELRDSSDEEDSNEADIPRPGIEHDDDDDEQRVHYENEQTLVQGLDDDDDDELSSLSDVPDDEEDQQESSEIKDEQPEQVQHQQHEQNHHQQLQQQPQPQYVQQSIEQHQLQEQQQQQQRTGLPDFQMPMPQKKRGPGRPPKNGIMSKREQQLAKKEAQQRLLEEQMQHIPNMGMSVPGKNKVGRPRKNTLDDSPVKTEKRKYTKRKPKEETQGFPQQHLGSGDENGFPKQYKEKKSTKPPRSPSPTFNEADLTPEQLAKPQANYVTLIHEALSNSPTGQMSLPQIYRAIQRRYPFFVLKCNTNGWQSSVRHNLSQHHAFRKVERDGKGWMWAIVDGVSIEKEKKRRPTPPHQLPPHMQQQPMYRAGPYMPYGPPGSMPPPGYMHPGMPPHMRPPAPPYMGQPMPGYGMPPGPPPPHMNGHPPPGYPPMPMAQPLAPQTGGYSSPYAPKPPGPPPPQQQPPQTSMGMQPQQHGPPPPQQPYQPQPPRPIQQAPPPNNDALAQRNKAIENFRSALVNSLKAKTSKADAIVASAISRVNGITTQSTASVDASEHKMEDAILDALKKLLANFPPAPPGPPQQQPYQPQGASHMQPPHQQMGYQPGQQPQHRSPYAPPQQMQPPPPQNQNQQSQQPVQSPYGQPQPVQQQPQQAQSQPQQPGEPQRQPLAQISPQPAPAQQVNVEGQAKPVVSAPAVQRPSFSGQSQNRASVPRPPMMTPGMSRNASGSGTPATAVRSSTSASPPTNAATPASGSIAQPMLNNVPPAMSPLPAPATAPAAALVLQQQAPQPIHAQAAPSPSPQPAAPQHASPVQQPMHATQQPLAHIGQVVAQAPQTMAPLPPPPIEKLTPVPSANNTAANSPQQAPASAQGSPVNKNGKRPLEEGMNGNDTQGFKRINSGPVAVKT